MGYYTRFEFKAILKEDSNKIVEILKDIIEKIDKNIKIQDENLPNHPFFKSERWRYLFVGNHGSSSINGYTLKIKSEFKNYDNEINKFLTWILPYIKKDKYKNHVYGECWGEGEEKPEKIKIEYSDPTWEIQEEKFVLY